jgi:hypothetical protein
MLSKEAALNLLPSGLAILICAAILASAMR